MQYCKQCAKAVEALHDTASGDSICPSCGMVLSQTNIVSEVTFTESATGAIGVQGSFVSADKAYVSSQGVRGSRESQEVTSDRAKRKIDLVASRLNIPAHIAERGHQFYRLALNRHFAKGRKSHHLVCACLYYACRQYKTPHMLMDFAEAICVNIFAIGSTYLQLRQAVPLRDEDKVPPIDPSIYVKRMTSQLEFGSASQKIESDAMRLAKRMTKDWIAQGRRPAGVAAAAVLLAARMNNQRRSKAQIVAMAKIGEETVQKRLDEFAKTNTATLSVSLFRVTNIESEADPPSFMRHRENDRKRREEIAKKRAKFESGAKDDEDEQMNQWAKEIDQAIADERKRQRVEKQEKKEERKKRIAKGEQVSDNSEDSDSEREMGALSDSETQGEKGSQESSAVEPLKNGEQSNTSNLSTEEERDAQKALLELSRNTEPPKSRGAMFLENYRKHKAMILAAKAEEESPEELPVTWTSKVSDDPDNLEDVDDDEIEFCALTPAEVAVKKRIWYTENRDYLIAEQKKLLKIEADKLAGTYREPKRRRKVKREAQLPSVSEASAQDQATAMVERKKKSTKLNYDRLGSVLFNND